MKLIIANWKSNKNLASTKEWVKNFNDAKVKIRDEKRKVIIAAPYTLLPYVKSEIKAVVAMGVQDISPFSSGKYTGEVSGVNLKGFDVEYAIIGHSERRKYFGETDQIVANKVIQCVDSGITPLLCVDTDYIQSQANRIEKKYQEKSIIVYEPISAIGTGDNESPAKVVEVVSQIKKAFGYVKVLYGGSVNSKNIEDYLAITDGVLVGTASLKVDDFIKLL